MMPNVDDFRGAEEVDSGTAFEIGFATALGKPVWAHTRDAGALITACPSASAPTPVCHPNGHSNTYAPSSITRFGTTIPNPSLASRPSAQSEVLNALNVKKPVAPQQLALL